MLKLAKYFYHNTKIGHFIIETIIQWHHNYRIYCIKETKFIKQNFKKVFRRELDLNNPKTLNEKIQWLKLNDRTPLHTTCADKYLVRDYVKKTIGQEYLIPLEFQSYNINDVVADNFPDIPFIIKTNHDSSGGIIVRNKAEIDWKKTRKQLKILLNKNYYYPSKEWQYKNIEPCVIAEKLLINDIGEIPFDYKLHCFNGKVEVVQVDIDRFTNHKRNLYNINWELLTFTWSVWQNNKPIWENGRAIEKPENLDLMINVAEKLAKPFRYTRIDLYDFDGHVYFGEITFHHGNGLEIIHPEDWDYKLGEKVSI